jgi:hypothetical protein
MPAPLNHQWVMFRPKIVGRHSVGQIHPFPGLLRCEFGWRLGPGDGEYLRVIHKLKFVGFLRFLALPQPKKT